MPAAVQASRRSSASITAAPGRMPWIAATCRSNDGPRNRDRDVHASLTFGQAAFAGVKKAKRKTGKSKAG